MEGQLVVGCGALATESCLVQHLQKEKKENKMPDTMATQSVTKPEGQPKPVEVDPTQKRKYKTKLFHPVDDDGEARPSQITDPEIITKSLSFDNLHNLWKDITQGLNRPTLTWLIHL
ncbi:hypothetical protein BTVI_09149 [Pitangus sulphuratus]|nr:hypothetical protein BTVI_09149 [Pitangus sulphuratus]